ncbi:MAG: AIR synthase-related protein [Patescibacteria group bacterium]|jgi:phosphoribosylformylglycinamidine cyclo-ligase
MITTYASSGVNIELGDDVSKILYNAAKATWQNRAGKLGEVIVPFDDFSGVRAINVGNLPAGTLMNIGFDGVGTKVEIAERVGDHSTMAFDLLAMVCDDAVVRGAEPVLVGSILDVNSLSLEAVKQLAIGYVAAAKQANVAIVNGEVAELGSRVHGYGAFNYNWGAAVVWFVHKDKMFTGKEIKIGDSVVALQETGFRSNGLSLTRKILATSYGENWHTVKFNNSTLGQLALTPSRIYSAAVVAMMNKTSVHGVVHVTGGGIPGKLGRVLKASGFGAELTNLFAPCDLMLHCQAKGNVPDEEAYKTWNMGNGMLIITPEPEQIMSIAKQYNIKAQVAGKIISDKKINIKNKGYFQKQQSTLIFP